MPTVPLAHLEDVSAVWRPVAADEVERVSYLIALASAKLRAAVTFDLDARTALYATDPSAVTALDPVLVAGVVAGMVKRVLVNPSGVQSTTRSVGPYSESQTFGASQAGGSEVVVLPEDVALLLPRHRTSRVRTLDVGLAASMVDDRRRWRHLGLPTP